MPRRARSRILYNGCYAHVFSRALDKRVIFKGSKDFIVFKKMLKKVKQEYEFYLYHYCLMNTHFHLLVSIPNLSDFSKALKEIKQAYAHYVQETYDKKGPIWWGRFGSQLIENERYLYACGLYVEMNPVKAEIVRKAEEWEFSSSQRYFLGKKDYLIDAYERPSLEVAMQLSEGLNVGKGGYIGSPLFILNSGDTETM